MLESPDPSDIQLELFFHSSARRYSPTCKFLFYLVCVSSLLTLFSECPCVLPWHCWPPLSALQQCKSIFLLTILTLISELEPPLLSASPVPSPHPLRCPLPA